MASWVTTGVCLKYKSFEAPLLCWGASLLQPAVLTVRDGRGGGRVLACDGRSPLSLASAAGREASAGTRAAEIGGRGGFHGGWRVA